MTTDKIVRDFITYLSNYNVIDDGEKALMESELVSYIKEYGDTAGDINQKDFENLIRATKYIEQQDRDIQELKDVIAGKNTRIKEEQLKFQETFEREYRDEKYLEQLQTVQAKISKLKAINKGLLAQIYKLNMQNLEIRNT